MCSNCSQHHCRRVFCFFVFFWYMYRDYFLSHTAVVVFGLSLTAVICEEEKKRILLSSSLFYIVSCCSRISMRECCRSNTYSYIGVLPYYYCRSSTHNIRSSSSLKSTKRWNCADFKCLILRYLTHWSLVCLSFCLSVHSSVCHPVSVSDSKE